MNKYIESIYYIQEENKYWYIFFEEYVVEIGFYSNKNLYLNINKVSDVVSHVTNYRYPPELIYDATKDLEMSLSLNHLEKLELLLKFSLLYTYSQTERETCKYLIGCLYDQESIAFRLISRLKHKQYIYSEDSYYESLNPSIKECFVSLEVSINQKVYDYSYTHTTDWVIQES